MFRKPLLACLLQAACVFSFATAKETEVALPAKENFYLFLLAGQSNMAGRGQVSEADKVPHPRVLMLNKQGQWVPAVDPIHYDKGIAGVGPGRTFAIALAEANPDITVGLIPSACGGSPIEVWVPGAYYDATKSHPYDDAVARTERAQKDGTLKGILWHQGEGDCKPELSAAYEENLRVLITRFRNQFGQPDLPFVMGQLGQFKAKPWNDSKKQVDAAQRKVAEDTDNVAFVSSDGLTPKSDNVHFDAEAQHEFGRRYAEAYQELQK